MESFDNFEILEEIGHGGMGKVYKARQTSSSKLLALKVVKENAANNPAVLQRFQKEGQAAIRLNHPNIVKTYGFGTANGTLYIGMEYIDGVTLADTIKHKGPFAARTALLITRQIAEALVYSHNLGIIHRDIKPQNILLTHKKQVKILDFGIAKTMWDFEILGVHDEDASGDMLMTIGQRLGTPVYMPPEQMRNEPIDGRADIYALGGTLYEMLTAKRPFIAGDVKELARQKGAEVHPGAEMLKKYAPPPVAALVLQMLRAERASRPRTASKLIQLIDETLIEMDALEKLRKRTGRFYDRVFGNISATLSRWLDHFLDFATEPRVIAWAILLAIITALSPILWPIIRFILGETANL